MLVKLPGKFHYLQACIIRNFTVSDLERLTGYQLRNVVCDCKVATGRRLRAQVLLLDICTECPGTCTEGFGTCYKSPRNVPETLGKALEDTGERAAGCQAWFLH